jgi:hypothetical protein
MTQTSRRIQDTVESKAMYVALELSKTSWKLAFSDGSTRRPRQVGVAARDWRSCVASVRRAVGRLRWSSSAGGSSPIVGRRPQRPG